MTTSKQALIGLTLASTAMLPAVVAADVIHLVSGSRIQVDAWRDVGDAIEFTRGGGIVRIAKADIAKIEGNTTSADLRMYSAPASLSGSAAREASDRATAVKEMTDFLEQSEGLFGQTVLSAQAKAEAFRRLGQKWRELEVSEALREAYARGQEALQIAVEAYTAEEEGTAPNIQERIEAAKKAVQDVRELVKKVEGEKG